MTRHARSKPPYTVRAAGRWFWQPRGATATVSAPQPLGPGQDAAWAEGWRLYLDARARQEGLALRRLQLGQLGLELGRENDYFGFLVMVPDGLPERGYGRAAASREIVLRHVRDVQNRFGREDPELPEGLDIAG